MMARYQSIKSELPAGSLLLFRLGDFYEAFFGDAKTVSETLKLSLTSRREVPMCGFPFHARKPYVEQLLKAGHKVALMDEWSVK